MLFSEIDLKTAAKDGEEYVATIVGEWFYGEDLTIIGEGEGTNELGVHIMNDGKKVYYLNEKGKYRPKKPGEQTGEV